MEARVGLVTVVAVLASAALAPAAAAPRLEGKWAMTGKVVSGQNLVGQKVGDIVKRTWIFLPKCAKGACNVTLQREKPQGGFATVQLKFDGKQYRGTEIFTGSYSCGGVEYPNGEKGPIAITARVTGMKKIAGVLRATKIVATLLSSFAPVAEVRAKGCSAPVKAVTEFTGVFVK